MNSVIFILLITESVIQTERSLYKLLTVTVDKEV